MTDTQIYFEIYTRPFTALYQAWGYYYSPLFYVMFLPAVLIPEWMVNLITGNDIVI
jgi:hypothetical protein